MRTPEETQRLHGERVEARQRERADIHFFEVNLDESPGELMARLSGRSTRAEAKIERAADDFLTAILLDIIRASVEPDPTPKPVVTTGDGIRIVPGSYQAQFCQETEDGYVWRTVHSADGHPMAYATPEAALAGAKRAKKLSEDHS